METASAFLCSKPNPLHFRLSPFTIKAAPLKNFNKQLRFQASSFTQPLSSPACRTPSRFSLSSVSLVHSPLTSKPVARTFHLRCSLSTEATVPDPSFIPLLQNLDKISSSFTEAVSKLTPFDVCKGVGVLSVAIAATKWAVSLVLNPFFWMYFSWTWLFWPWMLALALGIYGLYCLRKHLSAEANVFEQLAIVTSAFTWLTLVPPAHFNGFLQGWPYVFFFVYHYFFFFSVTIRKRLYGDYYAREHDPKWDISPPIWCRALFCIGVMAGHWLAAFEGPELHLIPGGWSNVWIWILIMLTLFIQYNSTFYLSKYSEKIVVPTAVVQFGPYRQVRHPVYSSTILLFVTYCVALRAPLSALFLVAVCLIYYELKVRLEEGLLLETFGDRYNEYMSKVKYKFIPFVY